MSKIKPALNNKGIQNAVGAVTEAVTAPLTENKHSKTQLNIVGSLKNGIKSLFGKGEPFYSRYVHIENSPRERSRGTSINPAFKATGKLSLRLADGTVREGALQLLDAIDCSEEGAVDPASAGLKGLWNPIKRLSWQQDKKLCDKLLELREYMKKNGYGDITVERQADGFSRCLKIVIDTENKTEAEIQKMVEKAFNTLGIQNKTLAKSVARELIHRRDTQEAPAAPSTKRAKSDPAGSKDKQLSEESRGNVAGEEHVSGFSHGVSMDGPANDDIPAASFSMSGDVAARPSSHNRGMDSTSCAAMQTQHLESANDKGIPPVGKSIVGANMSVDIEHAANGLSEVQHEPGIVGQGSGYTHGVQAAGQQQTDRSR